MADRVLAQMVGTDHEDDVALVIVQAEARSAAISATQSSATDWSGLVVSPNG